MTQHIPEEKQNLRAIMTRSKNSSQNLVVSEKTLIFAQRF